jgi:multiple sugar transport system substrate-binding protein
MIVFVICLAALAGSIAGCAKPTPPPEKPKFQGTLTLWTAPGLQGSLAGKPAQAWYDERAQQFQTENPTIKVEVRSFPSPADLEKALIAGTEGQPDVAFGRFLSPLLPRLADVKGLIDDTERDDLLPGAVAAVRSGEGLVGFPALVETQVLALNEQAFSAGGVPLPANGTWTLPEFEDRLRKLSGPDRFALGFYDLPGYHEWWPFAGGIITPASTLGGEAEAGLTRLAAYRHDGLLHPDTAKLKAEETWALFAQGKFAIMPVGSWALPTLRQDPYNVKLSVAGFPGGATYGYAYGALVFKQSEDAKLQAAAALGRWLTAPDQQVRLARETGLMPARKSAGNPFQDDPQLTQAYNVASQFQPLLADPAVEQAELQFTKDLRFALLGAKDPKTAWDAVMTQVKAATAPAAK